MKADWALQTNVTEPTRNDPYWKTEITVSLVNHAGFEFRIDRRTGLFGLLFRLIGTRSSATPWGEEFDVAFDIRANDTEKLNQLLSDANIPEILASDDRIVQFRLGHHRGAYALYALYVEHMSELTTLEGQAPVLNLFDATLTHLENKGIAAPVVRLGKS